MKNISRTELIQKVGDASMHDKETVTAVLNELVSIVKEEISFGRKVTIQGFGIFEPKENKERNGVNPSTGEPIVIQASNSIRFKASKTFKDSLN